MQLRFPPCPALSCIRRCALRGASVCATLLFSQVAAAVDPQVSAFVNKYCVECHQGDEAEGGADLSPLLSTGDDATSRKLWSLVARNIEFQRMPPEEAEQPVEAARVEVVQRIKSQVANVDCSGPIDPGNVTLRRLTRYEYRRTVLHLLGYDYDAVKEFPSDDVGSGFDNIGDVLSLSPLLYEKYLVAAEVIADAVVGVAEGDYQFEVVGGEIEATQGTTPEGNRHMLFTAADLGVPVVVPATGRYEFEVELSPQQAGPNWVQVALLVDGQVMKELELKEPTGTPTKYGFETRLGAGQHNVTIRFKNDFYQPDAAQEQKDRNLVVHRVKINGPFGAVRTWSDEFKSLAQGEEGQWASVDVFVRRLFFRAYRRMLGEDEAAAISRLVRGAGPGANDQYKMAIKTALVSPYFLFRVESKGAVTDRTDVRRLNDFDLATRLSYFLWSSTPDDWLLAEAAAGRLQTDTELRAVTKKMLADRRETALILNFVDQWLQLRMLDDLTRDEHRFPQFDAALKKSMRRETQLFLSSIFRGDRSVLEILDADYSYLDGRLAKLYGIEGVTGDDFQRVQLDGDRRGGVLTQAAVLAATARPTRTSPVLRGKWILENILNDPPPPPAPGVAQLDESKATDEASLREMLEQHRADRACEACHEKMDALGFALEEFDAIGAFRDKDSLGQTLDTKAEFPDGSVVNNAGELRRMLTEKYADDFVRCLSQKLFVYAIGRQVEDIDECALRQIVRQARDDGDRFAMIVEGIVLSDAFRFRRGLAGDADETGEMDN